MKCPNLTVTCLCFEFSVGASAICVFGDYGLSFTEALCARYVAVYAGWRRPVAIA